MSNMLMKGFGLSAATLALVLFGYTADAQTKKEPAKKPPPACTKLKEADCKARTDCVWTPEAVDAKTKKKTKASCKAKPKEPVKKADPKKADPKKK